MNRVLTVAALAAFIMLVMAGDPPPALAQTPDVDATAQEKLAALENALQALQRQIDEVRTGLLGQVGDPADVSMAGMATVGASPAVVRALADPLVDESELPPLGWTCPMHPEIHETHAGGVCPICKMDLVETRRAEAWTCPVHSVILEAAGGVCPIGGRELIPIRLQLTWTCPDHLDVSSLQPGMCPIDGGQRLVQRLAALPHEDHTPKHGGTFFMAPDNWHHVEGTYPEPGRFVLHVYDNYSKPMAPATISGRVVLEESYDVATDQILESVAYPLLASRDGRYLEASVGTQDLPTEIAAKVRFEPDGPEERFDFRFAGLTTDDAPTLPTPTPEAPVDRRDLPVTTPEPAAATTGTLSVSIPDLPGEIAAEIAARNAHVEGLIRDGAFTEIWIPALEAKDLALALTPHIGQLAVDRELQVHLAVKELVRAAWLLDWYGDLGNRQRVESAYAIFGRAATDIAGAYDVPSPR